ncbi:active breakpoint cluster region-related protein [Agrilus planipennis]|uniref:Active breakpoint cluster region-related protein n=1 Tax=Agrilus planipennis TaxID=224129 RepID=A0A1W4WY24_AGRPL|nr:active breakpoint cluster region-related protein [Agrilus planipennis]
MSVFGDFQQVWSQRFPQSSLPAAWEEDVRANLAKHKQKVSLLKEELEKEEFYVEYLERLLHDVEEHKKKLAIGRNGNEKCNEDSQVISDNLSKNESLKPTAPPFEHDVKIDNNSVNKCVTELSALLKEESENEKNHLVQSNNDTADPSSFVTVIEVNGLKAETNPPPVKVPPKLPVKPRLRSSNKDQSSSLGRASSSESLLSSTEQLPYSDEHFYDSVAAEADDLSLSEKESSNENVFTSSSTLQLPAKKTTTDNESLEPQSPGTTSNYVNIEYFIKKRNGTEDHSSSDEEEVPELRRSEDGSYASSSSLESSATPSSSRKFKQEGDTKVEAERLTMYRCILSNIIESETNYVEWLNVMLQYMKAIKATLGTSHPVLTDAEFRTIFYKITDLHLLHSNFLDNLKKHTQQWDSKIGESFYYMALNLPLYGAFLSNYGRAVDTVRKCSASNSQFAEVTKSITCKNLSEQSVSLENLLHKPVARVQKNALVLHDLLKYTPTTHPEHRSLSEALQLTQTFLDQFNMIQTKSMFPASDRAQRRLVKNSFIVEQVENNRKLRHLFLFNDVIACAKYKSTGRNEKYTFELKWFIRVEDIHILEEPSSSLHDVSPSNIVSLKSQASNVRDQLRQEEKLNEDKKIRLGRGSEKYRKRLLELESQLVLVSPNLAFRIKHRQSQKTFTFYLSSEFERTQWIEAIQTLQKTSKPPTPTNNVSMFELQTWITACRTFLKTNMGSYLLRSGHDESLLVGDLHITIKDLQGLDYSVGMYVCVEVDFYGHFFRKAKTKLVCNTNAPVWNETFVIDLEGCENLRILVYRETESHVALFGKHMQKLSRQWLGQNTIEKSLQINNCTLRIGLKFVPCEVSLRRVPTGKAGSLFGEKIQNVCKRQKRDIPFIVSATIREVERRGMSEVGIYRVSGSASDISKLKKSFETNSYEAEQLLKEVDIHSVTGILRLYLRELPEALFTDQLYPILLEAFNQSGGNLIRRMELLKNCFGKLPHQNKATIQFILEHLIRVNRHEDENKMSLHNLATVFGPTLLRPGGKVDNSKQRDLLATGTVDVMAQAGILYCYLQDLSGTMKQQQG